nr:unnamed protein product [Spirometra erinaceieuropaei]
MFVQLLSLAIAYGVCGQEDTSTLEFKQNSDYVYTKSLYGDVEYMTVDDVRISEATNGSHCIGPNDCWEIIRPRQYMIVNGFLEEYRAAFVLEPKDPVGRCSVGVQYKSASISECKSK